MIVTPGVMWLITWMLLLVDAVTVGEIFSFFSYEVEFVL